MMSATKDVMQLTLNKKLTTLRQRKYKLPDRSSNIFAVNNSASLIHALNCIGFGCCEHRAQAFKGQAPNQSPWPS